MSIDIKQGTLETLLAQDGIALPATGGAEKQIRCFNPSHDDKDPSMSVNIVKGLYMCHGCGAAGSAYDYLVKFRGMQPKDAADLLTDTHGWSDDRMRKAQESAEDATRRKHGRPKYTKEPYDQMAKGRVQSIATHDYKALDGSLIVRVMRYSRPPSDYSGRKPPKVMPFTPAADGGWWVCGPLNESLPKEDRRVSKLPLYRLPELERMKADKPNSPIWLVEGEKCCDSVLSMHPPPKNGAPPCTTLLGGSKTSFDKHDLAPLFGQKLLLISDTDSASRRMMLALGEHMVQYGSSVQYCLPEGEGGYDIADAISEGGWKTCWEWMQPHIRKHKIKDQDREVSLLPPMARTDHFRVLGYAHNDVIVVQKTVDHSIRYIKDTMLGSLGVLLTLAPYNWWLEQCGKDGLTNNRKASFADALIRAAEQQGPFDDAVTVYGRGAADHHGKIVFNMGGYILMQGKSGRLDESKSLGEMDDAVFTPGPAISISESKSGQEHGKALHAAIMEYRWEEDMHGRAFLGWLVTSIVGGALPFRPALWMLGPPASGKTWLLEQVLAPVLGNILRKGGDVTEAGLSGLMGNDSLPVYLDEFEPGSGPNAEAKFRNMMALLRLSTSGEGERIRAHMGGGADRAQPRFSVLISSVARRVLDHASLSRFYMIRLARTPRQNWAKIRDGILAAVKPEKMLELRSHIIRNTPEIVSLAHSLAESYNPSIPTRDRQIMGSLTAGASFLSGDDTMVKRSAADELHDDSYAPLETMLSAIVQVDGGRRMSISECLIQSLVGEQTINSKFNQWVRKSHHLHLGRVAERYGLKLDWDPDDPECPILYIARKQWKSQLLERTEYAGIDFDHYLSTLPEYTRPCITNPSTKNKRALRVVMAGKQVTVSALDWQALQKVGLINPSTPNGAKHVMDYDDDYE